jgi:hypothetical protein
MASVNDATTAVNSPLRQTTDNADETNVTQTMDPVEQAAEDSFPASDPPSWTPLTIGPPTRSVSEQPEAWFADNWPDPSAEVETDVLQDTLHRLEAALAFAAPIEEQEWTGRALHEMRNVQETLGRHVHDESSDRFLAAINLAPELIRRSLRLQQDREDLLLQSRMLLVLLMHEVEDQEADFGMIRRRTELLLRGLRQQEVMEKDLIFESLYQDVGTGD